jgi:signal transduction histidine kinase
MALLKNILNRGWQKFLFASFFVAVVVIGGVTAAVYTLRQEAINTHLKVAQLHARTFGDHMTHIMQNINLSAENIAMLDSNKLVKKRFDDIMLNTPYIRSLNLLDENGTVLISSNQNNVGANVNSEYFLPIPFLDSGMLRFGKPWSGRDLYDGRESSVSTPINAEELSFIPIAKKLLIAGKTRTLIIALNTDYFLNRYTQSLDPNVGFVDVLRIDGMSMFSTDLSVMTGGLVPESISALAEGKDSSSYVGIYKGKESLIAYQLLRNYPLGVIVHLDYEKTLKQWENQRVNILMITTILVLISTALAFALFLRYKKQRVIEERILKTKMEATGEMIGMIAHQWRQPLAAISAIFANIKDAYDYGELSAELMAQKNKQAKETLQSMSKTIDEFRTFFIPQTKKEPFCICAATLDAIRLVADMLKIDGVKLYYGDILIEGQVADFCDERMTILGYKNEFVQAVISLIKNSKEAVVSNGIKDGAIYIRLRGNEGTYRLEIADNGGGIKEELISKIFNPYFTTKKESIGIGMGLYIAKITIENNMNGKISFKNKSGGAIFIIELKEENEKK